MEKAKSNRELEDALEAARIALEEATFRLEEANDTLDAIRSGKIDALVVKEDERHQLYTLSSADQTYRIFIEQMTEGVITLNSNNNILYCNSSFAQMVGYPHEKVIGQPLCKFFTPESFKDCAALIRSAWYSNGRGELTLLDTTGKEIPVSLSCNRLDLEENISMSIIITDLSSQKKQEQVLQHKNAQLEEAERLARYMNTNLEASVQERTQELQVTITEKIRISEELRTNQERLTQILETMAEGVTITDVEGTIIYANPMAQKILHLEDDAINMRQLFIQGQSLSVDGLPLAKEEHPMAISMVTRKPVFDAEIGIAIPDRDRFYILVNAAPIFDRDTITGSICTFTDVTRRRIAIQQKDDFIGVASHELKTPITVIKTAIQLLDKLKHDPTNALVPSLIEKANNGVKRLGYLVEDLLDVSRLKEGQLNLNKTTFQVTKMLSDSISHLHMERRSQVVLTGDTAITLHADAHRIEQVVVNFINNAIKYAPDSKEIVLDVSKVSNHVRVSVTDEGPGITTEQQLHLFDRYYRTDYSGAQYSGLGLGLFISAEIIRKHAGNIGVSSIPGQGSTFWFTLPLQQ